MSRGGGLDVGQPGHDVGAVQARGPMADRCRSEHRMECRSGKSTQSDSTLDRRIRDNIRVPVMRVLHRHRMGCEEVVKRHYLWPTALASSEAPIQGSTAIARGNVHRNIADDPIFPLLATG